ncbi:hypothetical protein [Dermabacter jinjuensis]|uniref:Uncharacterized protein n=1 Tax=Dermabacter jinjuensis TaxID=1667168 RepID=A0ABN5DQ89_9MICO|nr:hypothetical protein [Dermabacter jinjuensis]ATH97287.1 hypothetical protein COP05_09490 [Dermabacter jinjuensis]UEB89465.1 hypothetical protein LK448_08175 [Dermabacter jinjuensis]
MAQPRTTALRRRLGGVVVGASVLASAIAISGTVPFETVSAFAVDTTCTPGTVTLSEAKVEKGKAFTALVCGLKEGTQVRGEYRHADPAATIETTATPTEGKPVELPPLGYSRDTAIVDASGRASVTFVIAEPGNYAVTVAPVEGGTKSSAQVTITEPAEPTPTPTPTPTPKPDPTDQPSPSPTQQPEPSPTEQPKPSPTEQPEPSPTPKPDPDPTPKPDPTEKPAPSPTEPVSPSSSARPSPRPETEAPLPADPSDSPGSTEPSTTPSREQTGEPEGSSTEAGGSRFVRSHPSAMSRIPQRSGYGRSADFGAVGSDYSKLSHHGTSGNGDAGGIVRPGPTPSPTPGQPQEEPTEGSTQLITDPSRQPLGLSVAWLIGGVIAGLGLAATGAIVLMRRNS